MLRLEGAEYVSSVEPHLGVVQTVILAVLGELLRGGGPVGTELQNGKEVGTGYAEMVFEGIVVYGDNAQFAELDGGDFFPLVVGAAVPAVADVVYAVLVYDYVVVFGFGALFNRDNLGGCVFQKLRGVHDPAVQEVAVAAVHIGIADILRGGNVVVSGYFSHLIAVRVLPVLTGSELERPGEAVGALLPALRGAGDDVSIGVVFHEGVYGIRAHYELVGGAAREIVHGGDFGSIQGAVDLLIRKLASVRTYV